MTSVHRPARNRPLAWVTVFILATGGLVAGWFTIFPEPTPQELSQVTAAQVELKTYFADYAAQLDTYQAAIQSGNGPALARADLFITNQRQELAPLLGTYLKLLVKLPRDRERLISKLSDLANDQRFQFTYTSLGRDGALIQASVAENEFDTRYLTLWQEGTNVLALNNYETEWQAQITNARHLPGFLIINGKTRQLEDTAPFLKIYQQIGPNLLDKTSKYLPLDMLEAFGSSEFIGQTASLKLDTLALDPEHIMAACDSCGLVSERSLWQWTAKGYQLVNKEILNEAGNALYAALVALLRGDQAPAWTTPFLSSPAKQLMREFPRVNLKPYAEVERGFVVSTGDAWQGKGFQYTIDGPVKLKVFVNQNAQGQWQVLNLSDLKLQAPGWSNSYVREPEVVAG